MSTANPYAGNLKHTINTRQLTMIGIGGVIGAGLFVGSGKAIGAAGPGIVVAYLLTGLVVILVMRMLAELATASPETGSFSSYASRELGPWAGLSVGWIYSYHWCVTVAFEAIAGGAIANQLFPALPTWAFALLFMSVLTGVNLAAVSSFARFEFWFALIKVAAIVVFIGIGIAAICGAFTHYTPPGTTNLLERGGLLPNGFTPLLAASLTVFFSYFGTELVTIAAGEAADPVNAVRASMRSVAGRILIFYVGSILVVVTLLPWDSAEITESPYTAVLDLLGIPGARAIMNLIVLTAVLSCLNSGLYSASRMLFSLAQRGEGPRLLGRVSQSGVPMAGVLAAASAGFSAVAANYFLPTGAVFSFLLSSSGAVAVIVYLCICATYIAGRRNRTAAEFSAPPVRMWGARYVPSLVSVTLLGIVVGMVFGSDTRTPLALTLTVTTLAVAAGLLHQRRVGRNTAMTAAK
ncbi:amino acid permease [Nocardia sp. NBC_00508]|uniref:amino acid permease n=1 Tax=Nocardia sp. NBC_00508 TaxID=2975992 RepID=UPI002E809566|nr:amino acid permease [Nocardia sp. NBC_00508]WUD66004.1 amino acid permease [Nocardia sp. NBC_00508]